MSSKTYQGGERFGLPAGTKYAVNCPEHGLQPLTEDEYLAQLNRPNARWCCPRCGATAGWSDEVFEDYIDWLEAQDWLDAQALEPA